MQIICYLKKNDPENQEKFTITIEDIFIDMSNVESISTSTSEELITLDITFNPPSNYNMIEYIEEQIKKIIGDNLIEVEITF